MRGYFSTYADLFREQPSDAPSIARIQIPLIQREYAQGRTDPATEEKREGFLDALLTAIGGGEPVSLDFVYGKVEDGIFHPLDGQQRLTTLFLIHWYVASLAIELRPDAPWTRFTYETRPSARSFCEALVRAPLPAGLDSPAAWIKDQPWYLYTWRNDPTIQSMLVMIDAIHAQARSLGITEDPGPCWERLNDPESPAVSFYLLPLEDMGSEEDLYIKMNSRGKPLTDFENFKAHFEQDIRHLPRARDFAHLVDGRWTNLLWPIHGGDNIVDDEFMRYIGYVTEICELREDRLVSGRLGRRARSIFGPENPRSGEHLDFLFGAFEVWRDDAHVRETFDRIFSTALPGDERYDPDKVVLFDVTEVNLFKECCHQFGSMRGENRVFTLAQSLLLYAVLLHLIEQSADFPRRVRVLRNLLAASAENEVRRANMPGLLRDVRALIVDGDLDAVATLSSNQVANEREKAAFVAAHADLTLTVFRLEDDPILRGTLTSFELDPDRLQRRAEAYEAAFADRTQWLDLTGALLATGEYQRRRRGSGAWQFGTASPSYQVPWRSLLAEGTIVDLAETRGVLAAFLDGVAGRSTDVSTHMADVMASWCEDRERRRFFDWRYYLVKYPAMRGQGGDRGEGRTGIYWGVDGKLGYSLCMLRTQTLAGYYRDPVLLQVWLSSGVGDAARNPWFSGYSSTPRWLTLDHSEVGMRSVAEGFELRGSKEEPLQERFLEICSSHDEIATIEGRLVLRIPQAGAPDDLVDTADRTIIGAEFLKELVAAGL